MLPEGYTRRQGRQVFSYGLRFDPGPGLFMKKLALVASLVCFSTVGASAADLASRPYTKAPVVAAPVYDWSGFYIGGSIGGRWDESTWTTTTTNIPPIPATPIN